MKDLSEGGPLADWYSSSSKNGKLFGAKNPHYLPISIVSTITPIFFLTNKINHKSKMQSIDPYLKKLHNKQVFQF
jgi:hypothetical protein